MANETQLGPGEKHLIYSMNTSVLLVFLLFSWRLGTIFIFREVDLHDTFLTKL